MTMAASHTPIVGRWPAAIRQTHATSPIPCLTGRRMTFIASIGFAGCEFLPPPNLAPIRTLRSTLLPAYPHSSRGHSSVGRAAKTPLPFLPHRGRWMMVITS